MSKVVGEGQGLNEQPRHGQGWEKDRRKRKDGSFTKSFSVAILAQAFLLDSIFSHPPTVHGVFLSFSIFLKYSAAAITLPRT